jgi:hypothetical protein
MATDEEAELTPEAKLAIQRYILKIAVPSAAVLSIISVAVGFGLDRIAREDAYTKAYSEIASKMTELVAGAASAKTQADLVVADIQKTSRETQSVLSDLKQQKADVESYLNGNYTKIADLLYSKDEFRNKLVNVSQPVIDQTRADLSALRMSLATWSSLPAQNGPESRISNCPVNTYAVGFEFQDESGLAHGALWTGHIVCRPLNLPK